MALNLANLRKNKVQFTERLSKEIENLSTKSFKDERIWSLTLDKAKSGNAIIRFLPALDEETTGTPFVRVFSHGYEGPGGWYLKNCPTTLNEVCPQCEANSELWATNIDSNQDIVRNRKRKLSFYTNILVVSDPANPQNEGKIFLYKFGKSIFDMIVEANSPVDGSESFNPYDLWDGRNFKLIARYKDKKFVSYDRSKFLETSVAGEYSDKELEKNIISKLYALGEFTNPKNFEAYSDLKKRMEKVLGLSKKIEAEKEAKSAKIPSKTETKSRAKNTKIEDEPPFDPDPSDEDLEKFFDSV